MPIINLIMFPSGKPLTPINPVVSNYILMVLGVTCPTKNGDRFYHKNHPEIPTKKSGFVGKYVYPQFWCFMISLVKMVSPKMVRIRHFQTHPGPYVFGR